MAISPEESLRRLIAARENARGGAAAVANTMAEYIARRVAEDTLRRRRTGPGQYYRAVRGAPPAFGSGKLAASMFWEPASGGLRASAIAGSADKRASLFEFGGCVLQPGDSSSVMKWKDSGNAANPSGWWSHHRLPLSGTWPEHPFIRPTVEDAIADGSLRRVAIEAGVPYDP